MKCKTFSCFQKKIQKNLMWFDDIIAHDFRKPQDGQHLSCQENVHRILLLKPPCLTSSIFRPFRLVMEKNNAHAEDTGNKQPSSHTHLKMFNDAAGIRIFFPSSLSFMLLASQMRQKPPRQHHFPTSYKSKAFPLSFFFLL